MRQLIALVALVATAACTNETAPTEPLVASLAGSYTLSTIDGLPLPLTSVSVSRDTTVLDTDVLVMQEGGEWSEILSLRLLVGTATATDTTFNLGGLWTRSGNRLTFRLPAGEVIYLGTATDTTLTLVDFSSFTYVFTR